MITLEIDPHHAAVARTNLERAGVLDRVEVRIGPAHVSLDALRRESAPPFDFVFLDADKVGYPSYLEAAHALTRPGGMIVVDNVVRGGAVIDSGSDDVNVQGVRRMNEVIRRRADQLSATTVQTVGAKGYDGFTVVVVLAPPAGAGSAPRTT